MHVHKILFPEKASCSNRYFLPGLQMYLQVLQLLARLDVLCRIIFDFSSREAATLFVLISRFEQNSVRDGDWGGGGVSIAQIEIVQHFQPNSTPAHKFPRLQENYDLERFYSGLTVMMMMMMTLLSIFATSAHVLDYFHRCSNRNHHSFN